MWSKPLLCRFRQPEETPLSPVPQGFAGLCPSRAWIGSTHSQTRRDTNFAIPGYSFFCHDTTAGEKIKDFSVCGHSCGQNRFCAVFCNRGKSSKRRRCKALRRFASPCPGYGHGTPKPPALPAAPHPDLFSFCDFSICGILCGRCLIITQIDRKIKGQNRRV